MPNYFETFLIKLVPYLLIEVCFSSFESEDPTEFRPLDYFAGDLFSKHYLIFLITLIINASKGLLFITLVLMRFLYLLDWMRILLCCFCSLHRNVYWITSHITTNIKVIYLHLREQRRILNVSSKKIQYSSLLHGFFDISSYLLSKLFDFLIYFLALFFLFGKTVLLFLRHHFLELCWKF